MQLIRGYGAIKAEHRNCVATIGNFDGVHLGHQSILRQVQTYAEREGLATCAIVFEPLPREFFVQSQGVVQSRGHSLQARIYTFRDKLEAFSSANVDQVLCLNFNDALRGLTAEQFVRHILVDGLGIRHLVVGDDFRFGCDRNGDFDSLCAMGEQFGFTVENSCTVEIAGERVSSTRIREALEQGHFAEAEQLLGRPFMISGRVNHGQKLGRKLGFPTINLPLGRSHSPVRGVYIVRVHGVLENGVERIYNGIANVGSRPTVNGTRDRLEVHLLNFEGDLYGHRLSVEFIEKIRGEQKFDSLADLKLAIADDRRKALGYFLSFEH